MAGWISGEPKTAAAAGHQVNPAALAMHSARELCDTADPGMLIAALRAFLHPPRKRGGCGTSPE